MEKNYTINLFAKRFLGRAFVESMKFHDMDYLHKALDKAQDMGLSEKINDIHAFQRFDLSGDGIGFKPEYVEHLSIIKEGKIIYKIDIARIPVKELKRSEFKGVKDIIEYRNWSSLNMEFDQIVSEILSNVSKYPKLFTINKI